MHQSRILTLSNSIRAEVMAKPDSNQFKHAALRESSRSGAVGKFAGRKSGSRKYGARGLMGSVAKSFHGAGFCFGYLFFTVPGRSVRLLRIEKPCRDSGNFIDCAQEQGFVCF